MTTENAADGGTPIGVNHVVLNVHDIEESHQFWTEIIGLKQVGSLRPRPDMGALPAMRFYSDGLPRRILEDFHPSPMARPKPPSSRAVLRLWHTECIDCQLDRFQNSDLSPRWGVM